MSLYLGNNLVSGVATPIEPTKNIGQIIQSTIPLSDAGLHLLDGSLISGSGSYSAFVTYISGLVSNYPDLFTTEANWQSSVTTYGVCGKFVYDSTNNTVRLPKITGFTEGTTDPTALGDLIQAGLPNITGSINGWESNTNTYSHSGAFKLNKTVSGGEKNGNGVYVHTNFDASWCNTIYGNSTTVQPQAIKVLYYIVIATSTKTNIEVDIDEIATDLNGKADVDLSNCTKPHIVETYVNGTSWYRVYSDGWCEQGGRVSSSSQTVNLLKAFSNTNYTVTGGLIPGTTSATYEHLNIGSLTTTSFYYTAYDSYRLMWYACGY